MSKKTSVVTMRRIRAMHREYFHALGRFVDRFGQTEQSLAWMMFTLCGMSWDDARALFSGMRMEDTMSNITRLSDLRKIPEDARKVLSEAFTQLRWITDLRNSLLHYGASFDASSKERTTSNRLRSLNVKSFVVSADDLNRLYHDLDKVDAHVSVALRGLIPTVVWGDPFGDTLQRAWLYRFPQQKNQDKKRPNGKARQRQP